MSIDRSEELLAILVVALVAASILTIPAKGEVFENPPVMTPHWDYLVDEGVLLSLTWSPRGDALAVVNNLYNGSTSARILVLSRNGTLLWDSGDLGKVIGDISWGPNEEIAAVPLLGEGLVLAIPSNGTVRELQINNVQRVAWNMVRDTLLVQDSPTSARVITPTGNTTLLIGVGKPIHDLGWSPDGRYAYLAADDGVSIFNVDNITGDVHQLEIPGAAEVVWSDDSRFIAVASQEANGYFKNLTVIDLITGSQWSVNRVFYDFGFKPGTHEILVGGNNLTLYSGGGEVLWETRILSSTIIVSQAYKILWHPSGDNVTLLSQEKELIVVDGDTGEVLWRSELGFRATYPAQDPKGRYLALIAGARRVVTYGRASDLATITVLTSECPAECRVVIAGDDSTKTFVMGPEEDLSLYATPGNYTISFGLQTFPQSWGTIIGNYLEWLLEKDVSINLAAEAGKNYEISPPLDKLRQATLFGLGKVVIKGPPDITVMISWGSPRASITISIPVTGEVTMYAVPGTYSVEVVLQSGKKLDLGEFIMKLNGTSVIDLTRLASAKTTTTEPEQATPTTTPQTHTTTTTATSSTRQPTQAGTSTTEPVNEGNSVFLYAVVAAVAALAVTVIAVLIKRKG